MSYIWHGKQTYCKAGKLDQFGVNFKVRVIIDTDVVRPFKKIAGKVVVETRFPIKHKDIIIQFEGLCFLRYRTKFDNRTTFHQGRESILENTKPESEGYQESPIRHVLLEDLSTSTEWGFYTLNSTSTFPFSLEIPGNPHLPAPFKNQLGSLVYRLAVYMKSTNDVYVEVGEKVMRFTGHHNLLENIEAMKPISVENSYKKSVFTRKKLVEVTFSIDSGGFLPEERIPFILYVKNPKCIPLELMVQLVQHLKYDAKGGRDSAKKRSCVVATKEREANEPEPETTWIDNLIIRAAQEPSFSAHQMYNVTYSLQFKVKIQDQGTVKGEAPVYIGTTRDPLQVLKSNANALDVPFPGLGRRGSVSSTHSVSSHSSAATTYSLPPAYSQLSSRIPSVETLPPAYDEVEQFENTQDETDLADITLQVPSMPSSPSPEEDPAGTPQYEDAEDEINETEGN